MSSVTLHPLCRAACSLLRMRSPTLRGPHAVRYAKPGRLSRFGQGMQSEGGVRPAQPAGQIGVLDHLPTGKPVTTEPQPYKRSLLRQQRSLNTRRAILRAAARSFSEQDFDSTTVEEICAAAGVGRSTFYLYFDSKERLLIELARATARGVSSEVDAWVDAGSVDHALRVFIDGLVRRMEGTPKSLAALVMRRVSAANVTSRPVPGDDVLFDDIFAGIVRDGQQRGEIRTDLDARQVGEALAGMTLDALQRWAGGDQEQDGLFLDLHPPIAAARRASSPQGSRRSPAVPGRFGSRHAADRPARCRRRCRRRGRVSPGTGLGVTFAAATRRITTSAASGFGVPSMRRTSPSMKTRRAWSTDPASTHASTSE